MIAPPPHKAGLRGAASLGGLLAATLLAASAHAAPPQALRLPPPIKAPRDVAYPGVIGIEVDATDLDRRIFRIHETVPVAEPGPLTLLFPQWLPGNHASRGQLEKLGGLTITADGQRLGWVRDPVEVAAFHLQVPKGVKAIELDFQFLSATDGDQGRIVVTPEMLNLQWSSVALYPAGYFARQIQVEAKVRLPEGWRFATALETADSRDGLVAFKPVGFETLVDSPLFAGRWFKSVDPRSWRAQPGHPQCRGRQPRPPGDERRPDRRPSGDRRPGRQAFRSKTL